MSNSLLSRLLPGTLGLLALAGPARAQQNPPTPSHWHAKPGTLIYLDGERTTLAAIDQVPDTALACAEGITGKPGVLRAFGDTLATRVLVVTTKARANAPATLALADRTNLGSAYLWAAAGVRDIAPPALAYITSHHPQAWLDGTVRRLTRKSTGAVKYQVRLADRWGWRYLCFTAAGNFVDDQTLGDGLLTSN